MTTEMLLAFITVVNSIAILALFQFCADLGARTIELSAHLRYHISSPDHANLLPYPPPKGVDPSVDLARSVLGPFKEDK